MGMKITKGLDLGVRLRQSGERASKRARELMRRVGKKIEETARDYAPRDFHGPTPGSPPARELERSIQMITPRDSTGRIQVMVTVGGSVGGSVFRRGGTAVNVDDYALEMHEGVYQLGPESRRKQAAQPGKEVGPKFLERAYVEHTQDLNDALGDAIMAELLK